MLAFYNGNFFIMGKNRDLLLKIGSELRNSLEGKINLLIRGCILKNHIFDS